MTDSLASLVAQLMKQVKTAEDVTFVSRCLRERQQAMAASVRRSLSVGERVSFRSKHGGTVRGSVVKIMQKNVIVLADKEPGALVQMRWKVPASLLTSDQARAA